MKRQTRRHGGRAGTRKNKGKSYKIVYGGTDPFLVQDNGSAVSIFRQVFSEESEDFFPADKIMTIKYKKLHLGIDESERLVNTVLLELAGGEYMIISNYIYKFSLQPGDGLVSFKSPFGGSFISMPYIVGEKNTYLLFEGVRSYIPNEFLDTEDDPYDRYYGVFARQGKPSVKKRAVKMTIRDLMRYKP